jgi:fatty acid desaturase
MDFMGGSSLVWLHQHNIGHHPYANREGGFYNEDYDPDSTSAFPIMRTHPNQPWKPHIQYQHIYSWFLIPFSGAKWSISDFKWVAKNRYNAIEFFKVNSSQIIELAIFKTVSTGKVM